MRRRTSVALALLALTLSAVVAGAAVTLAPPREHRLSDDPAAAERVTLYQNGLGFAQLDRRFTSDGNETRLVFHVPTTTVLDSLRVAGEGVAVREIRSTLAPAGPLRVGDALVVHVDRVKHAGTLLALEGHQAVLQTAKGSTLLDLSKADAIEVAGRQASAREMGAAEVTVLARAPAGARNVTISYLYHGGGWTPSYHLDAATGETTFFATLSAPDAWRDVQLRLVAGSPRTVYAPRHGGYHLSALAFDAAGASAKPAYAPEFAPSAPLGELHVYAYPHPVSAERGETLRLPVLQGRLAPLRHYHAVDAWTGAGDLQVLERLQVRNEMGEPLPAGTVRIFREGVWIADDALQALPAGEQANLTLATSMDVKAHMRLVRHNASSHQDSYEYELTVRNLKHGAAARAIDLRVSLSVPAWQTTIRLIAPAPDLTEGERRVWDEQVPAGGVATFRLAYDQHHPPR